MKNKLLAYPAANIIRTLFHTKDKTVSTPLLKALTLHAGGEIRKKKGSFAKVIQKIKALKTAFSNHTVILTKINFKAFRIAILFFLLLASLPAYSKCVGRFVNPMSDICWKCIFPLKIAGVTVVRGNPSPETSRQPLCLCKRPPLPLPVPGIPISFWEPVRLVDVTRTVLSHLMTKINKRRNSGRFWA